MISQFCRECKHIMTLEEMDLHLKDFLGLCLECRAKKHAEGFKGRMEEAQTEEEI